MSHLTEIIDDELEIVFWYQILCSLYLHPNFDHINYITLL